MGVHGQIWREIHKKISPIDVIIYAIIPVFSIAVFFLPTNIQNILKLDLHNPLFFQFFTGSFVHENAAHLIGNMITYCILMVLLMYIVLKMDFQMMVRKFILLATFVLPIVFGMTMFLALMIYPETPYIVGASGIISSLLGFIPIIWIWTLQKNAKQNLWLIFFVGAFVIISFVLNQFHINVVWSLLLLVIGLGVTGLIERKTRVDTKRVALQNGEGFVIMGIFLLFVVFSMYSNIDIRTNYSHYIGLICGMILAMILIRFRK